MGMKEPFGLNYPALVFGNKVGLVLDREYDTVASIGHLLLLGGHLPVDPFVSELVHQEIFSFFIKKTYPRFS